jgi:mercuric ion binding protein
MKNLILSPVMILLSFCTFLLYSCSNNESKKEEEIEILTTIKEGDTTQTLAKLNIEGMSCEISCAGLISKKLNELNGVKSAEVVFEKNLAEINYDETKISEKDLIAHIEKLNEGQYKVTKIEIEKTVLKTAS